MQPLIKKVLRYINTRINKNSKFLIIQKKQHAFIEMATYLADFKLLSKQLVTTTSNAPTNISY